MDTIENTILKSELENTKQKLELANMDLQAKEKAIECMNDTIKILQWRIECQNLMISQATDIADKLIEKLGSSPDSMIGKKDIMAIFNKESDFALRFLRTAKSMGIGIQVGKEYYIKREEFDKILSDYQGSKLEI